ncbi:MAG TPA: DUF2807 domain-containing protein [Sphingomicrobium sp.]|nr:DUF2807 domain-containing protein [Sphingomicrobium sp.]
MRSTLPFFAFAFAMSVPALAGEAVPIPHFDSVELRGGGSVTVVPGPVQRVTLIEGSSQFTRFHVERGGQLKIDTCNGRCPEHYRMRVEIQSPQAPDLAVSGGGAIAAQGGFAPQRRLAVAVDGGGKIDARSVEAASVTAAVNGGGQLLVHPRSNLSAAVSGGGSIRYWGNPQVTTAINGGGSVRPGY